MSHAFSRRWLTAAVAVSAGVIVAAPFMGELRNVLRATFPTRFPLLVGGAIGLAMAAALGVAALRVGRTRPRRLGALVLAVAIFAGYSVLRSTGVPEVDAVERFHFVEYGAIAALYYRAFVPAGGALLLTMLAGTLVGILEEWVQWLVPIRVGVAQDVLLNVVALTAGTLFAWTQEPPRPRVTRFDTQARRRAAMLTALVLLTFGGFVHFAHLGYEVADTETGSFRSYFTKHGLIELRDRRATEWQRNPPRTLAVLAIEDYYMTEAGWHVQARNDAEARGAYRQAALENRILEKYYAPFLDVESFLGRGVHRWPVEQRQAVEDKGAPIKAGSYTSLVLGDRIVTRPTKTEFWILVAAAVSALLLAARFVGRPRAGT